MEYYNDQIEDDAFAELAWPENLPPVAVLAGDQADFAPRWEKLGWRVVKAEALRASGVRGLIEMLTAPRKP